MWALTDDPGVHETGANASTHWNKSPTADPMVHNYRIHDQCRRRVRGICTTPRPVHGVIRLRDRSRAPMAENRTGNAAKRDLSSTTRQGEGCGSREP